MAACDPNTQGQVCPPASNWAQCNPWDISQQQATNCYADSVNDESTNIAGADLNVHKLLGIHEQTSLVNLTGHGKAISGGDNQIAPASNAFVTTKQGWKSKQGGLGDITTKSYIGYDFGPVRIPNGRQRYGIVANERKHITAIRIKQGPNSANRVTKIRVERSENGKEWYGVAILALPDNDQLNLLYFKQSVPSRYWRLRPLDFNGDTCDFWEVLALELIDYAATDISNIQDKIMMENRDRDYAITPILLKCYYDLISPQTMLTMFGMELPTTYTIKINFNTCVALLGRPVVIGDILELPSEAQYSPTLQSIKKYLIVKDVTWDSTTYTPGWLPTMLLISAEPAYASQETQDIFGDLAPVVDQSGLFNVNDGNATTYQDYATISQTIYADSKTEVPERGSEGSNVVREFTDEELALAQTNFPHLANLGFNRTGVYVEDGIPQNGAAYTEGPVLPDVSIAKHKEYHRLTFVGLAEKIPARLYRFSKTKNSWIYQETDRREQYNAQKAGLEEYTTSKYRTPSTDIK